MSRITRIAVLSVFALALGGALLSGHISDPTFTPGIAGFSYDGLLGGRF